MISCFSYIFVFCSCIYVAVVNELFSYLREVGCFAESREETVVSFESSMYFELL